MPVQELLQTTLPGGGSSDTDPVLRLNALATAGTKNFSSRVTGDAADRFKIDVSGSMSWGDGTNPADVTLSRSGAGTLEQKAVGTSQNLRLYGSYTDATTWSRTSIETTVSAGRMIQQKGPVGGSALPLQLVNVDNATIEFYTSNSRRWIIDGAAGHFTAFQDNLQDFGGAGARPRSIYFGTQTFGPNGNGTNPSFSFSGETNTGMFWVSAGNIGLSCAGTALYKFSNSTFFMISDTATMSWGAAGDLVMTRDAANVLALKNGANAQTLRVYGATAGSVYAYLSNDGTNSFLNNSAGNFQLGRGGTSYWQISTSGHFLAQTDNVNDIGATGANRPRQIFVATNVTIQGSSGGSCLTVPTSTAIRNGLNGGTFFFDLGAVTFRNGDGSTGGAPVTVWGGVSPGGDNTVDLGIAATNRWRNIYFGTQIIAPDGTALAPSYSFSSGAGVLGLFHPAASTAVVAVGYNNVEFVRFSGDAGQVVIPNTYLYAWSSTGSSSGSTDLGLRRGGADILQQSRGVNAQAYRLYNTTDSDSAPVNYERISVQWTGNVIQLLSEKGGTGTVRNLSLGTSGNPLWTIAGGTGHLLVGSDNTNDIGASGATRPRTIYAATSIVLGVGQTWAPIAQAGAEGSKFSFSGTLTSSPADFNCWTHTPVLAGAFTVTRLNYLDLNQVTGAATVTDAAVFRFDAAIGTHKALASPGAVAVTLGTGPTGANAGNPLGWMKINVNGAIKVMPFW